MTPCFRNEQLNELRCRSSDSILIRARRRLRGQKAVGLKHLRTDLIQRYRRQLPPQKEKQLAASNAAG